MKFPHCISCRIFIVAVSMMIVNLKEIFSIQKQFLQEMKVVEICK